MIKYLKDDSKKNEDNYLRFLSLCLE